MKDNECAGYEKYRSYERMYIRITWIFILLISVSYYVRNLYFTDASIFVDPDKRTALVLSMIVCAIALSGNLFKQHLFNKGILENDVVYFSGKLLSLLGLSFVIIYSNIGSWLHIALLMPVAITCLTRGLKPGLFVLAGSFSLHLSVFFIWYYSTDTAIRRQITLLDSLLFFGVYYLVFLLFAIMMGMICRDGLKRDVENRSLMEQLGEKYRQLEAAQDEIKLRYEELKAANEKLELSNKKLSDNIAEFYTLQQISQAIGSILDVKELLRYLNDIILGVMGVSFSTIMLYDEKAGRLKVHTTNISNTAELATVKDNINCKILLDALNNGENILENNVNSSRYVFTRRRRIKSLICLPLNTKTRKFGLILVEHTYGNAFTEDNLRLLSIIAKQVGMVMENADLYNRMTELARKDGLTGAFNRQYFQERLAVEFQNAKRDNYALSLAIFDIDHFKKFNDTYGHLFGDKVLVSTVETVASALRKSDLLARYGGEEFIILFIRTGLKEAYDKAEALRERISRHIVRDNLITASVTVSFGVSTLDESVLSETELVKAADDALYEAKAAGRNCVKAAKPIITSGHAPNPNDAIL